MNSRLLAAFLLAIAPATFAVSEEKVELIEGSKGNKELVYRDERLAEERVYDERGALIEEKTYDSNSLPLETRSYVRIEGRLARIEARDADGEVTGTRFYHYDRTGMLLGESSTGSLGDDSVGMIASESVPQGSWITKGNLTTVLGYDDEGRVDFLRTIKEGKTISLERRTYGTGSLLASVSLKNSVTGSSTETIYDASGRPSLRTDIPAKGPREKTEFRYDDAGRLVEETSYRGGHKTAIKKSYDDSGNLVREETRRDGELLLSIDYIEGGRIEELYENGTPFVRATYSGGRKVKDEFIDDGKVVRSKEYQ
jgi:antitoxin component YwqK of YwqJK toxin-antitoxin module